MEGIRNPTPHRTNYLLPVFVLLCGLGATALATYFIQENFRVKDRQRFLDAVNHIERTTQIRMETYSSLLRGGAALFAASPEVTLDQFRTYYRRLHVEKRYPGIQGFGFTAHIPPEKLPELTARMRREVLASFSVWPDTPRAEYHSIIFLEPQNERNRKAIGYDMYTDPDRQRAMAAARDTGEPQLTRKVRLVQELDEFPGQPGFLLYLPVYLGAAVPPTLEERRARHLGFVYSPFRAHDFLEAILPAGLFPELTFAIWDGTTTVPDSLLYKSDARLRFDQAPHHAVIDILGHPWTLAVGSLPGTNKAPGEALIWLVPLVGTVVSLLLSYLTLAEGNARVRSENTANELFNQSEWLQVTLRSIGDGVISTDTSGRIQFMNALAEQLTGWELEEARKRPLPDVFPIRHEETGEPVENPARQVLATGQAVSLVPGTVLPDRSGEERSIEHSAAPIRDRADNTAGVVLVFREISERRRSEKRIAAQHSVTRILADASSIDEAAGGVLEQICRHLNFEFGVFWLFDHEAEVARAFRVWHSPSSGLEGFHEPCLKSTPPRGEGVPGLIWKTQKPIWISGFTGNQHGPGSSDALKFGIQTAFAFPVSGDNEEFGALEFFSRRRSEPDLELQSVAQSLGAQLAQFIQRKRAEQALAESEELYRAISETAADGIVVINEENRILTVNHAIETIFGYGRSELIGQNMSMLIPEHMRSRLEQGLQRLQKGQEKISWTGVEFPGLTRDGRELPLEISFGAATRQGRQLLTGLIRDVSRRKESERLLRETEERFALLVRLAEEYAVITMGPEGEVTTWNPGAERIFGYADEDVMGRDLSIFYTEADHQNSVPERHLAEARREGQVLDERWLMRKGGSKFWASGSLICLRSEEGDVRGFAKILRDVTERKRAEEAIHELNQELEVRVRGRTAALQESKEQMEAFSYTVAHDLRAPLRAMQGFAHALVDDYGNTLDPAAVGYLRRIMTAAQRMDELIQDLLAYSQLSRSDLSFSAVSVREVAQAAVEHFEVEIKEKTADIRLDVDDLQVMAHANTLTHVLGNLISNALKFARPDEKPQIQIRASDHGDRVRIHVQDNGIGIAPRHHDRIFRVFERLHDQGAFPGNGIGLAMVKKGIERMGGTIGLESEPDRGSQFWLELPKPGAERA